MRNLLFSLLSSSDFDPSAFGSMSESDWQALYSLSCDQGVAAMVWDKLGRAIGEGVLPADRQPSRALKIKWALTAESVEAKYARQKSVIGKLAGFFAGHGIGMMVIKGYGLSLDYPFPCHRPCSDIDIWLFEERRTPSGDTVRVSAQQRGDALLREHMRIDIDEDKHHHTVFCVDGVPVENHYDFMNVHAHRSNRAVEARLAELVQRKMYETEVDGAVVYLPPSDFHALFLLRHSASHFAAERIVLRHLLDWRYFVSKYGDDVDWQGLTEFAEKMNMHRFLHGMNSICIDCLGMPSDRIVLPESDGGYAGRMLDEILRPEFSETKPVGAGYLKSWSYMFRRWWANRWKHGIVYRESLAETFFVQIYSHLLKPKSLKL